MEKDALFQMASTTKPLTATGILLLEEDGKLKTTDPVAKYFASFDHDRARRITVAHLLNGSSGFRIGTIMYPFEPADGTPTLRKAADKFGKEGAAAPIDVSFSYSDAAFNAAGALIEHVSGMGLEEFWIQRIYKPLGMVDSLNHQDPSKLHRMATHYGGTVLPDGSVEFRQGGAGFVPGDPPRYPVVRSSGGLVSTALDYGRFLQMFLDGGRYQGGQILSSASVKKATTGYVRIAACPPPAQPCSTLTPFGIPEGSYGLGFFISDQGSFSALGGGANSGHYVWVDPGRDLLGVALTTGGRDPRQAFQRLIEEAVVAK
jgi:CubicO group peptidase (beta-lactamase class C family)